MEQETQQEIAKLFCEECLWAYECWITYKKLCDVQSEFYEWRAPFFHERLGKILHQYSVLQICKLHDPAKMKDRQHDVFNLTIKYMVERFEWGDEKAVIDDFFKELNELYCRLKPARDKVIGHIDLGTVSKGVPVGYFDEGLDDKYFESLQEFVSSVHEKWVGGPYLFKDTSHAEADVQEYLGILSKEMRL